MTQGLNFFRNDEVFYGRKFLVFDDEEVYISGNGVLKPETCHVRLSLA